MGCSTIEELGLDQWGSDLLQKIGNKRFPLSGMFELTDRCNLGCVQCYINQSSSCQTARQSELSTDEVKYILDQVVEGGCLNMTFTGGEVLLRPDFTEIYLHARRLGLLVGIFTNATLLTQRIADVFAGSRPKQVEITLYGATRETYEKVTGVPGSFDQCMRGIELLLERNINIALKTVILTLNVHELTLMRVFAEERGLDFRYDGNLMPRLDGNNKPFDYRLPVKELVAIDDNDPDRHNEWEQIKKQYSGERARAEYVYACGAGLWSFHVSSLGYMSICAMARRPSYDLRQLSFVDAWQSIGELRELKRVIDNKCRTCTLGALCTQCPGWSQLVHGDNETPVDYLCEMAQFRAK